MSSLIELTFDECIATFSNIFLLAEPTKKTTVRECNIHSLALSTRSAVSVHRYARDLPAHQHHHHRFDEHSHIPVVSLKCCRSRAQLTAAAPWVPEELAPSLAC